jgi:hypothetical protein
MLVQQGLARLTGQFQQPNIRALLAAYLQPLQDVENVLFQILQARMLATATLGSTNVSIPGSDNIVFDYLGALVGLARNGQGDQDYQALIYLQAAVNRATGRNTDWSRFALLLAPWYETVAFTDGDNADFQFGMWNLTLTPLAVWSVLRTAVANGVGAVFAFTQWADGNDFAWSDWYDGSDGQGSSGQGVWGAWPYDTTTGGLLVAGFQMPK